MEAEHYEIMIVDDEKDVLNALANALERSKTFRCATIKAENGTSALHELEYKEFDLIISDYKMPGMNGIELLAEVRERWPQTVRILITGYSDPNLLHAARTIADVDFYLKKPWDNAELIQIIHYAIKRKHLINELRDYSEHLEEEVQHRTRELIHAEKLASLGQLAASIAHEVNTPLTNISLYAQMLKLEITDPKAMDYLEIIINQVKSTSKIISGLLDFSQIADKECVNFDINEVVTTTFQLVKHRLELDNIVTELHLGDDLPFITASPIQLQQVVLNLIMNAHHAIGKDGTITVATEKVDENEVLLTIADTGKGIPTKDRARIFEPFFTTRGPDGKGTGLGLYICRKILKSHNGSIDFTSEEGKGTTFYVRLIGKGEYCATDH